MAQETNILIQISDDGATWTDLVTLNAGTVSHRHSGLSLGTTKYYRTIAKGDGVNTLDSDPSPAVSVASGFIQRYQDVLDKAVIDGVGTPSFTQNLINDRIVRNLIKEGYLHESDKTQDELVYLWFFQQETGTPYQFLTYNWVDPTKHRLTKKGVNDVTFTAGQGFEVSGGNSQYFNANFNPTTDHVRGSQTDVCVGFKLFNAQTVYADYLRIAEVTTSSGSLSIANSGDGLLLTRVYDNNRASTAITQSEINSHWQISKMSSGSSMQIFKEGQFLKDATTQSWGSNGIPNASLYLFASNYLGTDYPSPGGFGMSYFYSGKSLKYGDKAIYEILNSTYGFDVNPKDGAIGFTTAATSSFATLYYPKVYKSDPFKAYFTGITKNYIVFYSTNHAGSGSTANPANGAIGWGECDHPDLSGYVDKGIVAKDTPNPIAGYQSETPSVIINPNDPNGHNIWFFYHPGTTYPDANGIQQTRLLTTTGGTGFNDCVFTDRGKVLGLTAAEQAYSAPHTGYSDVYFEVDGSITVMHVASGWTADNEAGIPKLARSTCPGNNYTFTRVDQDIDITSFMPYNRQFHQGPSLFFKRNGVQYAAGRNCTFIIDDVEVSSKISIYQCDGNYHPTTFLGNISGVDSGSNNSNAGYYIEGDTLYIYYIKNLTDMYVTTWDLKNLDP